MPPYAESGVTASVRSGAALNRWPPRLSGCCCLASRRAVPCMHMDIANACHAETPAAMAAWLEQQLPHAVFPLWIVLYKKSTGKQTLTYDDVLAAAICHGLIDTQTKTVDAERYGIALYPRRPGSNWTPANQQIAQAMIAAGRMTPAGLAAHDQRRR